MRRTGNRLLALLALGAAVGVAQAAAPSLPTRAANPQARAALDEARRVSAKIDEQIFAAFDRAKVAPGATIDDAAFLRRSTLDIIGKIPVVNDSRRFLTDPSPEKRADAVQRLLDSPGYVNHFTTIWRELLIPEANQDFQRRYLLPGMDRWLRNQFKRNVGWDKMVRELVALPMGTQRDQQMYYNFYNGNNASPMTFYFAKQGKPEDIAASVVRTFLGVRLECAQCHNHPFGKWTREEFWSQAAFFAGLKGRSQGDFFFGPLTEQADRREVNIPNTDRVAQARFLDGKQPRWKFKVGARTTLAEWMTSKTNPFFARALVNRMWAHFFGIGLVDPVDDLVDDNKPSHPELLEMLAQEFANHDFDLKFLIRAITLSKTYQLSSAADASKPTDVRLFARMPVKGLSADVLYDSLCVATGVRDNMPLQNRIYQFGGNRQTFSEKFTDQDRKTEYHTSIPQALTMMNNQFITEATHPDRSIVLGAVISSPWMSDAARIETLYLAALSRKPRPEETSKLLHYLESRGSATSSVSKKKALSDVFWALLNSTEFKFNH
jgi:hypothetical protein